MNSFILFDIFSNFMYNTKKENEIMTDDKIREPIQKRSIAKKENIIKSGFDLMCQKGYYNTTTPEIAKAAGVSTGIVYNYFHDKKEIFIEGIKKYANSILFPMLDILEKPIGHKDLKKILEQIIQIFVEKHTISQSAHEELLAMSHLEPEIEEIFKNSEMEMTKKIVTSLEKNGFKTQNLTEKVHISIGLIENLCHEIVYHKHPEIQQNVIKAEVLNIIIFLLIQQK